MRNTTLGTGSAVVSILNFEVGSNWFAHSWIPLNSVCFNGKENQNKKWANALVSPLLCYNINHELID